MISIAYLWIPFALVASLGQVARNAMQKGLTASLGTVGATLIRFLFGFPFAVIFLLIVFLILREWPPLPPLSFWAWLVLGGVTQITGTGLMLAAMQGRSFLVTTAYTKTEPIQAAIFGFVFLSDPLSFWKVVAISMATLGVVLTAIRPGDGKGFGDLKPTLIGLASAAAFALSSVGYRGAILAVPDVSFVTAASFTLMIGLFVQTIILVIYLVTWDRKTLQAILRLWKPSMFAGFIGALASQLWFFAFALTAVANVRTLSLIEVLFAQAVSYHQFKQKASAQEIAGIILIVAGVALLIALL